MNSCLAILAPGSRSLSSETKGLACFSCARKAYSGGGPCIASSALRAVLSLHLPEVGFLLDRCKSLIMQLGVPPRSPDSLSSGEFQHRKKAGGESHLTAPAKRCQMTRPSRCVARGLCVYVCTRLVRLQPPTSVKI